MSKLYKQYLAATAFVKIAERIGIKYSTLNFDPTGKVLDVHIDNWYVDSSHTFIPEETHNQLRTERERIINELLEIDGAYCDRSGNRIDVFLEAHGVEIRIVIGEALCERVQTGTKIVEEVDPEYLETAPKITVEEPVYEIRCSDDIMGSVSHNE